MAGASAKTQPILLRLLFLAVPLLLTACGTGVEGANPNRTLASTKALRTCSSISGIENTSPWVPDVPGVSREHEDDTVEYSQTIETVSGPILGLGQPHGDDFEMGVDIPMPTDLGEQGSLTITAEPVSMPDQMTGSFYPLLVSLNDGSHDWISLTREGNGSDCRAKGYFICDADGNCDTNPDCNVRAPSAYVSRADWAQHNIPSFGQSSTNTFPTCDWSSGSPGCAFNSDFFVEGKLPHGRTYRAKFIFLATDYSSTTSLQQGRARVTVTRKRDTRKGGAVELNVILVGEKNIRHSRTEAGKINLNSLFQRAIEPYTSTTTAQSANIGISKIRVFEWACNPYQDLDGNALASADVDSLGTLFKNGTEMLREDISPLSVNLFLVSDIRYSGSAVTVLGVSGAIGAPPVLGDATSGLAFSTFDLLASMNPNCVGNRTCSSSSIDATFFTMASTISHELGHALGLNHPSESNGTTHDRIPDTPKCVASPFSKVVNHYSCLVTSGCQSDCSGYDGVTTFCADRLNCQFNHAMWYTTQKYKSYNLRDGVLFSPESTKVLNFSPFIR